jgi:hypothetical protein
MNTFSKMRACLLPRFGLFLLLSLFGFPSGICGQKPFRIGGVVAGQVTDVTKQILEASRGRFLFGPTVEAILPKHLALEVDGLYQSKFVYQDYSGSSVITSGSGTFAGHSDAYSWEVPTLLQWHAVQNHRNVFFGGGVTVRAVYGTFERSSIFTSNCSSPPCPSTKVIYPKTSISDLPNHRTYGGVIDGGLEFRTGFLAWRPQVRYTRWNASIAELQTELNGVQGLLSISFGE